ncbi:kinase-like domain-containing protein [Absidia repens]|uniref:non-specific serine/threonine protein kinase n=1 Tax=Absidia repens TaxID=90262 RepID=A0A1X2IQ57_9FUNG|nr:kinase-like domain-containing protein [Absidia repens]
MTSQVIQSSYQHDFRKENHDDYPAKSYQQDEDQCFSPTSPSSSSSSSSSSSPTTYFIDSLSEKCCYKQSSPSSFIQRCIKPKNYNRKPPSSNLESRYGRLQNGNIGRGAYASVRLIVSHNHHQNYHHHHSKSSNYYYQHDTKTNSMGSSLKQIYAVKIFKKKRHAEDHGKYMKRLISEYCIASSMHHPNIIKTLDLVTDASGRYCIVMEYCSGGDLYQAIKKDKMTLPKINSYFKQLILGLDYLHSLGVAHRDVKPENLILSGDGHTLKITDFGVADVFCETWQRHSRLSDGFCGSLAFIAPEVFSLLSNRSVDDNNTRVISSSSSSSSLSPHVPSSSPLSPAAQAPAPAPACRTLSLTSGYQASKVDVWSAAIVYCCMLFKGTMFNSAERSDPNYRAYLNSYPSRSFVIFDSLDTGIRSLLYHMLDPDPEQRISTAQILQVPFINELE